MVNRSILNLILVGCVLIIVVSFLIRLSNVDDSTKDNPCAADFNSCRNSDRAEYCSAASNKEQCLDYCFTDNRFNDSTSFCKAFVCNQPDFPEYSNTFVCKCQNLASCSQNMCKDSRCLDSKLTVSETETNSCTFKGKMYKISNIETNQVLTMLPWNVSSVQTETTYSMNSVLQFAPTLTTEWSNDSYKFIDMDERDLQHGVELTGVGLLRNQWAPNWGSTETVESYTNGYADYQWLFSEWEGDIPNGADYSQFVQVISHAFHAPYCLRKANDNKSVISEIRHITDDGTYDMSDKFSINVLGNKSSKFAWVVSPLKRYELDNGKRQITIARIFPLNQSVERIKIFNISDLNTKDITENYALTASGTSINIDLVNGQQNQLWRIETFSDTPSSCFGNRFVYTNPLCNNIGANLNSAVLKVSGTKLTTSIIPPNQLMSLVMFGTSVDNQSLVAICQPNYEGVDDSTNNTNRVIQFGLTNALSTDYAYTEESPWLKTYSKRILGSHPPCQGFGSECYGYRNTGLFNLVPGIEPVLVRVGSGVMALELVLKSRIANYFDAASSTEKICMFERNTCYIKVWAFYYGMRGSNPIFVLFLSGSKWRQSDTFVSIKTGWISFDLMQASDDKQADCLTENCIGTGVNKPSSLDCNKKTVCFDSNNDQWGNTCETPSTKEEQDAQKKCEADCSTSKCTIEPKNGIILSQNVASAVPFEFRPMYVNDPVIDSSFTKNCYPLWNNTQT